jgi:hypothetical protein
VSPLAASSFVSAVEEDATARVEATPDHGNQLPQVRGEDIEQRRTAAGCAGRGVEEVDVRGLNYTAHEGGDEERVGRLMNKQESAPTPGPRHRRRRRHGEVRRIVAADESRGWSGEEVHHGQRQRRRRERHAETVPPARRARR